MRSYVRQCQLSNAELQRFGRQLILPEFGPSCQEKLSQSRALVIGAGGLGSAVIQYLAGAGVGTMGIVDGDQVDVSNLHRQTIHKSSSSGTYKSESAACFVYELNSQVETIVYTEFLSLELGRRIAGDYDVLIDCTDNVTARYLINDLAVEARKPVVSGSALRTEGQLTVYNYDGGPCYRCIFPTPPPAHAVTNCSDGGVLGPIPAVIGSLQAVEAIKVLSSWGSPLKGILVLYDGMTCTFRRIKLRPKVPGCVCSGKSRSIQIETIREHCTPTICGPSACISTIEFAPLYLNPTRAAGVFLLDVRNSTQFSIVSLRDFINIPLRDLTERLHTIPKERQIYVMCRRGVDSASATSLLRENGFDAFNVVGGLQSWFEQVDDGFPLY